MKKAVKHIIIIVCTILVSLMATYIGLAVYYRNAFTYGTWINNVYCTGHSIQEVNDALTADFSYDGVTVYDRDGRSYQISAEDIHYQFDFRKALEIYRQQQNPWMWIESLFHENRTKLSPVITYDMTALQRALSQIPCIAAEEGRSDEDHSLAIIKTNHGYELVNERMGVLQVEDVKNAVVNAIEEGRTEVRLEEENCYRDLELTEQMREDLSLWEQLEPLQQCCITYRMGDDQIVVDGSVVCDWLELDENGRFTRDEDGSLKIREGAVEEFVDELADRYDTVGAAREFHATRGGVVTIEGGTYGNKIDREAETAYLTQAFLAHKKEVHEPAYVQKALVQGQDDIGGTYIEVDMGQQMMYYYEDGVQQLATPVVTGNTSRRMGTPSGVNYVYMKQQNRTLRGADYASHVDFWMPVKGNIGIHDASWRSEYGGTIYQTNGSHGCINTPRDMMALLYDRAEVGTPVVMFY